MNNNSFLSLKFFSSLVKLFITAAVIVLYLHYFIPQSWGFYTIDSNIQLYSIYEVHNGIADKVPLIKNNMSYGMGMSRKGKVLFDELYIIISNRDLPWKRLNKDSLGYITQHENHISLYNFNKESALRGIYLITKTDRPSYEILKNGQQFIPSEQYILTDIR
jgi:hypothetical protein